VPVRYQPGMEVTATNYGLVFNEGLSNNKCC
jgi:hypothetical protein